MRGIVRCGKYTGWYLAAAARRRSCQVPFHDAQRRLGECDWNVVNCWPPHVEGRSTRGRQRLEVTPYRPRRRRGGLEAGIVSLRDIGMRVEKRVGPARLFLNVENLTNVRQTQWDSLLRPSRGVHGCSTEDAWAPVDGRVINGGCSLRHVPHAAGVFSGFSATARSAATRSPAPVTAEVPGGRELAPAVLAPGGGLHGAFRCPTASVDRIRLRVEIERMLLFVQGREGRPPKGVIRLPLERAQRCVRPQGWCRGRGARRLYRCGEVYRRRGPSFSTGATRSRTCTSTCCHMRRAGATAVA